MFLKCRKSRRPKREPRFKLEGNLILGKSWNQVLDMSCGFRKLGCSCYSSSNSIIVHHQCCSLYFGYWIPGYVCILLWLGTGGNTLSHMLRNAFFVLQCKTCSEPKQITSSSAIYNNPNLIKPIPVKPSENQQQRISQQSKVKSVQFSDCCCCSEQQEHSSEVTAWAWDGTTVRNDFKAQLMWFVKAP